jgi:aspartyl-tRNA synthetase
MSFINQEDILNIFENLIKYLFKNIKNIDINDFPRLTYDEAMKYYGSDKPDIRFDMKIVDLEENLIKKHGFKVFDDAEFVAGICAQGCANYSRKQIDELTDFVKKPQLGANGLIFIKLINNEIKSSIDKFFSPEDLHKISYKFNAKEGDLILLIAGQKEKTQKALCELRLELGKRLNLIKDNTFAPLWVIDFPMFEWDEETNRFYAKHHPFTSPKEEDIALLETNQNIVRANAYDLVINGVEIGGGSIRIHKKSLQKQIFKLLGFDEETANKQFGFLMDAFEYGAPPHGGIALGLDRLCAVFSNADSIRDFIAFPKNNAARDIMAEAPSFISQEQLKELKIKLDI